MTSRSRKRKHRLQEPGSPEQARPSLYIQAHEADLVRGPQAIAAARSLEVVRRVEGGRTVMAIGDGLIQWNLGITPADESFAEDHFQLGSAPKPTENITKEEGIWVDRYALRREHVKICLALPHRRRQGH